MEPVTALIAAAKALTELNNLAKTLGNRVPAPVREQISALYDRVSALQNAVLEKQQQAAELAERCRQLEDDLKSVNDWETERKRYTLKQIGELACAYVQEPDGDTPHTPHWLCANCFEDRKKAYLQPGDRSKREYRTWKCQRCNATFVISWSASPSKPKSLMR